MLILMEGMLYVSQRGNSEGLFLWEQERRRKKVSQSWEEVCAWGESSPEAWLSCSYFGNIPGMDPTEIVVSYTHVGLSGSPSMGVTEIFYLQLSCDWDIKQIRSKQCPENLFNIFWGILDAQTSTQQWARMIFHWRVQQNFTMTVWEGKENYYFL